MPEQTLYEDFDVQIELVKGRTRTYRIQVLASPAGEGEATALFPFEQTALERHLDKLEIALLKSAGRTRTTPYAEEKTVQTFGGKLFRFLTTDQVGQLYAVSRERTQAAGAVLRIKLRIQDQQLATLPWEFLYDKRFNQYVVLSQQTPLIRYLDLQRAVTPLQVNAPLKMLGMVASPTDFDRLDVDNEKARVEAAVAELAADGLIELTWLEGQTWRDLQRAMRRGTWHIFHFIGHGGFNKARDEGVLYFADKRGNSEKLSAVSLARLLGDHRSLRVVFLNACEGGQQGHDVFSSTGATLVRRGIPCVLAMQYVITDRAAIEFSQTFYEALADGVTAEAALSEARISISIAQQNSLEWGTPVMFSHTPGGRLFDETVTAEQPTITSSPLPKLLEAKMDALETAKNELEQQLTQAQAAADAAQRELKNLQANIQDQIDDGIREARVLALQRESELTEAKGALAAAEAQLADATAEIERQQKVIATQDEQINSLKDARDAAEKQLEEQSQQVAVVQKRLADLVNPPAPPDPFAIPAKDIQLPYIIRGNGLLDTEWCWVPGGPFRMGEGDSLREVYVDSFWIGRTPVTNAQYQRFIQATGHNQPKHWNDGQFAAELANHPVVYVSWYDANKYCEWLSKVGEQSIVLPTDAQWEKAARGWQDARKYPWGSTFDKNRCNSRELGIGKTSAVDQFTNGATPYGALDMSGNVWEWTRKNSLRGGSWPSLSDFCRVASRNNFSPDFRCSAYGFRVCCFV